VIALWQRKGVTVAIGILNLKEILREKKEVDKHGS